MIKLTSAQLWVHDQDEALEFWTKKVGMEVRADVTLAEMGNFRWLTVGPAGQPGVSRACASQGGTRCVSRPTMLAVREPAATEIGSAAAGCPHPGGSCG